MIKFDINDITINYWPILNYFKDDLENLLITEKKLIENSEKYSQTLIEEFRVKVDNDSELRYQPKTHEEGSFQAQYYQAYYNDTEKINSVILQNYRKASLLSIFSILEGQLKLLSKLVEDEFDFSVKTEHITASDYINKYWLYLTKVFELNPVNVEGYYNQIREHRFVRNKIAHDNSEISNSKVQFVKQTKGLSIRKFGDDNILEIDNHEYLTKILTLIETFFEKLTISVDKRYGIIKNAK